ncbi:hypothetical protein ASE75_12620 [Sphingomonas sp. Leaf17]|nr:hypothetical protein ASE75_12620 [Sphingomonas sp. Leaf17]
MWFRVVAVALLVWGLAGCFACIQQFRLGAGAMGSPSAYDRALYDALPVWYNAVYAVAVGCGVLGAAALLGRSVLARPLFALSSLGVAVQFGWLFATTDILAVKGVGTAIFPAVILGIAIFGWWLAGYARRRRWIG